MSKTIYVIQGYDDKIENDRLVDVVVFEVFAEDYKSAIEKAKKYYPKKNYRIASIIEK